MKKVSIRQSLDGRSFSVTEGAREGDGSRRAGSSERDEESTREGGSKGDEERGAAFEAEAELLTWQTLLVPVEAFDPAQAPALLAAAGMACTATQQAVWSQPQEDEETLAVMALDRECRQQLEERFAEGISFTTPLLHTPQGAKGCCVWLRQEEDILYIKVYDRALRLAEAIPLHSEADPIYLIGRLGRMFPLWEFDLRTSGSRARALRKALGSYFRSASCE